MRIHLFAYICHVRIKMFQSDLWNKAIGECLLRNQYALCGIICTLDMYLTQCKKESINQLKYLFDNIITDNLIDGQINRYFLVHAHDKMGWITNISVPI